VNKKRGISIKEIFFIVFSDILVFEWQKYTIIECTTRIMQSLRDFPLTMEFQLPLALMNSNFLKFYKSNVSLYGKS